MAVLAVSLPVGDFDALADLAVLLAVLLLVAALLVLGFDAVFVAADFVEAAPLAAVEFLLVDLVEFFDEVVVEVFDDVFVEFFAGVFVEFFEDVLAADDEVAGARRAEAAVLEADFFTAAFLPVGLVGDFFDDAAMTD